MARPETAMVPPAITFTQRSSGFRFMRLRPSLKASTTDIIVAMVTAEKRSETRTTPLMLCSAAGYMRMGISGSQGPSTKTRKRIHGVRFVLPVR